VATYKIPAPASINGTLQCTNGQKGAAIIFTDFADVDRATAYTATLTPPSGTPSVVLLAPAGGTQVTMVSSSGKGTYTFHLTAKVGSWAGPALQQSVTC
jgi:hypothetical protein